MVKTKQLDQQMEEPTEGECDCKRQKTFLTPVITLICPICLSVYLNPAPNPSLGQIVFVRPVFKLSRGLCLFAFSLSSKLSAIVVRVVLHCPLLPMFILLLRAYFTLL